MTQDAILANEKSIENIIKVFNNYKIGCAYGRQLPHKNASLFSSYARLFNYKDKSYIYSIEDKKNMA